MDNTISNTFSNTFLSLATDSSNNKKAKRALEHDSDEESSAPRQDDNSWARFLVIHSETPDKTAAKLSPFAISKGLKGLAGELKEIKKLRSGDLLVECERRVQSDNLLRSTMLVDLPISVRPHQTLNTCKGVIRSPDLADVPDDEMVEELNTQGVLAVKRLIIKRNGNEIHTSTFFITFNTPTLPKNIKAGYLNIPVRAYIPNPLRCYKCQKYGHGQNTCKGSLVCFRCGQRDHDGTTCQITQQCANCKGEHMASSKDCPMWTREKEVQKIKAERGCSFPEARRLLTTAAPPARGTAPLYATVVKPKMVSIGCQTDHLGGARPRITTSASQMPTTSTNKTPKVKQQQKSTNTNKTEKSKPLVAAKPNVSNKIKPCPSDRLPKHMKDPVKVQLTETEGEAMDILNYTEDDLDPPVPPTPVSPKSKKKIQRMKTLYLPPEETS